MCQTQWGGGGYLRPATVGTKDLIDVGEKTTAYEGGGAAVADETLAMPMSVIK